MFFVFLKLVKPNDALEDVIVLQNEELRGKKVTSTKLLDILERFGPECLLILDGLDECALGQNSDVLKVIKESKFSDSNILLTSRPHSIKQFEKYFDVIISVEGFTLNEARKFASRIVPNRQKVEQVLDFNPAGERSDRAVHNVPILLSFLCLLVREDNIDLSDKTISKGEIYFRMVRCLYKKFTIRKDIEFHTDSFVEVLESLGKLALETLLSRNPLLRRSEIVRQVSSYVFDYGLLIGHEDFRLIRDETADISLTFPHRSLQEFLAAFFFVLSLGKKQTVKDLDDAIQEFLKSPLFSEFCLWFLDESNRLFSFPQRSTACEQLGSYVAEQIDGVEVDCVELEEKYPVLGLALKNKSEMALTILDLALKKCRRIKHFTVDESHPRRVLRSLQPVVFEQLKSIEMGEWSESRKKDVIKLIPEEIPSLFVRSYHDRSFNIKVKFHLLGSETSWEWLDTVLKCSERWGRSVHLHVWRWSLFEPPGPSLLCTQWPSVHALDYGQSFNFSNDFLFWIIPKFPQLVKLFLNNCDLIPNGRSCFEGISSKGELRKLSTLDIRNIRHVGWILENLLCSGFPALDTLLLSSCDLSSLALSRLARASATERLPKLSTLDISNNIDIGGNLSVLFCSTSFPSLHSLFLSRCELNALDVSSIAQASEQALLPQLKNLDVSFNFNNHSSNAVKSNLGLLRMFPRLDTLVVRGCRLQYNDLYHMYQRAITDCDHFSKLTTLDMTFNPQIGGYLSELMCQYFPNLSILVLRKCELNSNDLFSLAQASTYGRLPELRHLDISQNFIGMRTSGLLRLFGGLKGFPSLINLMLCDCNLELQDLCCLVQARLDGKLPRIKHLDISLNGLSGHVGILSRDPITQREISWGNVICYEQ